jgi:uncharacterized metal-binding protein
MHADAPDVAGTAGGENAAAAGLMRLKVAVRTSDQTTLFSGCRRLTIACRPPPQLRPQNAMNTTASTPLVYSCSGCSSAAQLANAVALKLDRAEIAEMSCIAGVGGDVPSLLRTAKSGRPIVALDGCALACVRNTLARHGLDPALHVLLSDQGVRKRYHTDFDPVQAQRVFADVSRRIARALPEQVAKPSALVQPKLAEGACP